MTRYIEAWLVVDGSLDVETISPDEQGLRKFIVQCHARATLDHRHTELYILRHDHYLDEDCDCVQYLTSHHPAKVWN